jgi:hypothetical protein
MANTVIAIFQNAQQAQQAKDHLLAGGFSQSQVNIKTASYKDDTAEAGQEGEAPDLLDNITAFFKDLFAGEEKEASAYAVAAKNRTIVTVHTESSEDAEQVANILDTYGALDVNETPVSDAAPGQEPVTDHHFSDHPAQGTTHASGSVPGSDTQARAAGIKSRIIQRSVDKTN